MPKKNKIAFALQSDSYTFAWSSTGRAIRALDNVAQPEPSLDLPVDASAVVNWEPRSMRGTQAAVRIYVDDGAVWDCHASDPNVDKLERGAAWRQHHGLDLSVVADEAEMRKLLTAQLESREELYQRKVQLAEERARKEAEAREIAARAAEHEGQKRVQLAREAAAGPLSALDKARAALGIRAR